MFAKVGKIFSKPFPRHYVFWLIWLVVFALYLPAAKAGFVADFTGWLDQVKNHSFLEHINRTNYHGFSLYQFTQFNTYILYKLFGTNAWLWHLLFITLHTFNAFLLYKLCINIMKDAGIKNYWNISLFGVLLYSVSPGISEVLVWEPAFHFLQGMLLILLILLWLQRYLQTGAGKYAWYAGTFYLLSTFSLEVFYITPLLVFALILFYHFGVGSSKLIFSGALKFFLLPELLLFGIHLLVFHMVYGRWIAHIGSDPIVNSLNDSMGKPAKYLFNTIFLGRFFSNDIRFKVYSICDSALFIKLFYGSVLLLVGYIIFRFRSMGSKGKVASLLFFWTIIALVLIIPIWFSDIQLVQYDRYTYFFTAFLFMLIVLLFSYISIPFLHCIIIAVYACINARFTFKENRYWMKSERVISNLLKTFPDKTDKTVILLNIPQNMNGIPMIGAEKESEYKLMHDLLLPEKTIKTRVYDAMAYNMTTPADGANVMIVNDSTIKVTLNQWGTWWWFAGMGGGSYENDDYKINMTNPGHEYLLILKKQPSNYLLLYNVGSEWKTFQWNK